MAGAVCVCGCVCARACAREHLQLLQEWQGQAAVGQLSSSYTYGDGTVFNGTPSATGVSISDSYYGSGSSFDIDTRYGGMPTGCSLSWGGLRMRGAARECMAAHDSAASIAGRALRP